MVKRGVETKTVRAGVIGVGGIATNKHIPSLLALEDVEVAAVCDINPARAEEVAGRFEVPGWFTDYTTMLKSCPELDAVVVATPNAFHKAPTIAALRAGKHVLCEKPIAANVAEAKQMCAAARRAGKILMIGQTHRFVTESQALKRFVDAGLLGPVYAAKATCVRRRGIPGWGDFLSRERSGGGALIDIGVHCLDLALYLMGHPRPVAVSGATYDRIAKQKPPEFSGPWTWDPRSVSVEDAAYAFVRFANGAILFLEATWASNTDDDGSINVQLVGERGGCTLVPCRLYTEQAGMLVNTEPVLLPDIDRYNEEISQFIEAIRTGGPSPVPGEQAVITQSILDAVYESAKTGREVRIGARGEG